ncbi:WAT1-related protein At5g64700 [Ricinus communis]|uniref:WAT1-related protein n=1 Tax=Ricinus communis TaxID=3988 RepID=B9T5V3_RICCO|nr:WAT1-related protein At5g64700 [Ricinus communis]EEF28766.1 Auxin-induced protein 5NG4, putative [Ricinus communis]|eukprot:XP_002533622.1 WAT1-related protein At5g64700 [Ricinus communis]
MGEKKAYLAVLLVQSIYAGMFLISKAAFNGGMNNFVFVFYRQAAATIFLAPLALFLERKKAPPMSFVTFCKLFMLSLCGVTLSLDIYGLALVYTSATLAAATTNCLPVITFFLALLLRMEVLKLRTSSGIAKLIGIVACMGGAATLAFFKGPHFRQVCHHHLFGTHDSQGFQGHVSSGKTWVKGCFLMLMSNTCWGLWLVLQVKVLKSYPSKLLFTTLQCFLSSVQSFVIAIALVRDPHEWMLGWNVKLLAVLYCGIMVTGVTFYIQAWIIEEKGPVFLAMSTPLNLIFTVFCSAILLCEIISLGSLLGGLLLVAGLYSVLWGKSKEEKICMTTQVDKECSELKQVIPVDTKEQLPV